jgi:hypothetical protein
MNKANLIPIEPGYSGKAHILEHQLFEVICDPEFSDMTLAEVLGVLEIVKLGLVT